jgi:CRP-like cAMP-binding protein
VTHGGHEDFSFPEFFSLWPCLVRNFCILSVEDILYHVGGIELAEQMVNEFGISGVKKYFQIGDTIARMGEQAQGWFILLTGKVGVFKRDFSVAEISERGTVFGEMGGILNIPRTATLQALEPTSVLFVTMSIDEVIRKHPEFAKRIMVGLAERLARTTDSWWFSAKEAEVS